MSTTLYLMTSIDKLPTPLLVVTFGLIGVGIICAGVVELVDFLKKKGNSK